MGTAGESCRQKLDLTDSLFLFSSLPRIWEEVGTESTGVMPLWGKRGFGKNRKGPRVSRARIRLRADFSGGCGLTWARRATRISLIRVRNGEEPCPSTIFSVEPARKSSLKS